MRLQPTVSIGLLLAVACGGSDGSENTAGETTTATEAAPSSDGGPSSTNAATTTAGTSASTSGAADTTGSGDDGTDGGESTGTTGGDDSDLPQPVGPVPTPDEVLTLSEELDRPIHEMDDGGWPTAIATYNDAVYFTWVAPNRDVRVLKHPLDGSEDTVATVGNAGNDGHNLGSLGIDRDGFIHVAYGLHGGGNDPWIYKVSEAPESVDAFSDDLGGTNRSPPNVAITYPQFLRNHDGRLFLTYRHRVGSADTPGWRALGLARYDESTQRWTGLGGTDYEFGERTFFWDASGRNGCSSTQHQVYYQAFQASLFFDSNHRLHVAWDVYVDPGCTPSHVMYAFSDDDGDTWQKANGDAIVDLPITVPRGDVVAIGEMADGPLQFVGRNTSRQPVVRYGEDDGDVMLATWTGAEWELTELPGSGGGIGPFHTDLTGVMTYVRGGQLFRSSDDGATWKSYARDGQARPIVFDRWFSQYPGQLRYKVRDSAGDSTTRAITITLEPG